MKGSEIFFFAELVLSQEKQRALEGKVEWKPEDDIKQEYIFEEGGEIDDVESENQAEEKDIIGTEEGGCDNFEEKSETL